MKMLKTLFVLSAIIPSLLTAQEANTWLFGNKAMIKFSGGSPVSLTGSSITAIEGSASISDASGNLLFYSSGPTIWNKNHSVMANGTGLMTTTDATQPATIVKKPGSNSEYYVFSVGITTNNTGLRYSIVDMTMNSGLGEVVSKNTFLESDVFEKACAVRHSNGSDVWLIYFNQNSQQFKSRLISSSGISTTPVISNFGPLLNNLQTLGQIKASPNGCRVAMATWERGSFLVMDFDKTTGILSNMIDIYSQQFNWPYGVEFSPDGTKIYGSTYDPARVYQMNLQAGTAANIASSAIQLAGDSAVLTYLGMQLAPDGKIYIARENRAYLSCIPQPNINGVGAGFVNQAITLVSGSSRRGLPTFINDYFKNESTPNNCELNVSIDESSNTDFHIFPNPSEGTFYIRSDHELQLSLYTLTGELIRNSKSDMPAGGLIEYSVSDLNPGIYILKTFDGKVQRVGRVMISR